MSQLEFLNSPSPNHDARRQPLDMLVLHYTGMETGKAALDRLCNEDAKVSSHYLVEEDGRIFQLVEEDRRAWHAGVGRWAGRDDINSRSVGVEIVNGGHEFGLPAYPDMQIDAVIALCKNILGRNLIPQYNIVGHSDVAPQRKEDPGEHFPWRKLARSGIGYWPTARISEMELNGAMANPAAVVSMLGQIGYDLDSSDDQSVKKATAAFQRRWRPVSVTGDLDAETRALIDNVCASYADLRERA